MKFSLKIFISFFVTTFLLGTALIWIGEQHVANQTREEFITRYLVFSKVMGDTLNRLDHNIEALMFNAAKVIQAHETAGHQISTQALKEMRSELNVTHAFIIDKTGRYLTSTNEDPKLIPNVYTFCDQYHDLISGDSKVEATPIIRPNPEPLPYKFLFIPSKNRQRLIEVGVRVDFSAKTLTEALGSDENIVAMSLYEPNGNSFGKFTAKNVNFNEEKSNLPIEFPKVIESKDSLHFFTKVNSSHQKCCQCDVNGTSKGGEYYYVLETEVSKRELTAILARTTDIFILLVFCNFVAALIFARFISRKLVSNIELAAKKVREIKSNGVLGGRLNLKGKDEMAFLTEEFDRLLDSLEDSQNKIIESEIIESRVQLAREVAHNIQSPIVAIEIMLPNLKGLPEKVQKVFKDSAREIKALAARLSKQADLLEGKVDVNAESEEIDLIDLILRLFNKKRIEYSESEYKILLDPLPTRSDSKRVLANELELTCILSNLINNSVESFQDKAGYVTLTLTYLEQSCLIKIADNGRGIPRDVQKRFGMKNVTFGKINGKGIGVYHALKVLSTWGWQLSIESSNSSGTTIEIEAPLVNQMQKSLRAAYIK